MAAATAMLELAGTPGLATVVKGERLMDGLTSYGERNQQDDNDCMEEMNKHCIKSDEEAAARPPTNYNINEADKKAVGDVSEQVIPQNQGIENGEDGPHEEDAEHKEPEHEAEDQEDLLEQEQDEKQNHRGKKSQVQKRKLKRKSSSKDSKDSKDSDTGGRPRKCTKQSSPNGVEKRPTTTGTTTRRTQRRLSQSGSPAKDEDPEFLTRTRGNGGNVSPSPATGVNKASKRSKRVAQRLANEEPPPPPLKLPKLHLVLTRKEIQEDWMKITGQKYTGKPKKSTLVQRGFGLCTSLTCPSSIRYLNDPQ